MTTKYKPIPRDDESPYLAKDPKPKDLTNPFYGRFGWILRFIVSAFFGGLFSFFVFLIALLLNREPSFSFALWFWDSKYVHIFWIIPIAWGILGIFFFDEMTELPKKIFG